MRKIYLIAGLWAALFNAKAQQSATFEDFELPPDSMYNGKDGAGGFLSGDIWFPNEFTFEYNFWSGFSVSSMRDTITAGYDNQYSAITAGGVDDSQNYAVAYFPGELNLELNEPVLVEGFFITNSVYSYMDMKYGSGFTKKFGGPDGTDSDFFKLIVTGIDEEGKETGNVEFLLADFSFDNHEEDYIVDDWVWFDLTPLGKVSELSFSMASSDTGAFGINTPAYFCMDNFTTAGTATALNPVSAPEAAIRIYPNPVAGEFIVELTNNANEVTLLDSTGKIIFRKIVENADKLFISALSDKPAGIYYLVITTGKNRITQKIIKY